MVASEAHGVRFLPSCVNVINQRSHPSSLYIRNKNCIIFRTRTPSLQNNARNSASVESKFQVKFQAKIKFNCKFKFNFLFLKKICKTERSRSDTYSVQQTMRTVLFLRDPGSRKQ